MNRTRKIIILIFIIGISVILLFSFTLRKEGNNNPTNTDETAETEQSLPVHDSLFGPPITDINGPFTIEYMYTKDRVDYIKITDSSPQGRMNALHWLREHDINPTDLNIRFDDFTNPLGTEGD